jgi:hypothetical protein
LIDSGVKTSIGDKISQVFRNLPKFVYVGAIAGFASKFITPIYGIGLKCKKRELLLAIHAFYLKI